MHIVFLLKYLQKLKLKKLKTDSAAKIRSGLMMIGALSHHLSTFSLPHSGGCKMGARTIAAHRYGLAPLGIDIETTKDRYEISVNNKKIKNRVVMYEASDTGTTNVLLAAARLPGPTELFLPSKTTWSWMFVISCKSSAYALRVWDHIA